jgi:segregation and condensation protein A
VSDPSEPGKPSEPSLVTAASGTLDVSDPAIAYRVDLPDFEGPLDLLLHLVKKHELDILNIPIAFITDQYLRMLDVMRSLDLDVAGEYLLMAATLAHLKSRELVPPDPVADAQAADGDDEDDIDPRQELIRRLLEYQKFKDAAGKLADRPVTGRNVFPRGSSAEDVANLHVLPGGAPLAEVPVFRLIESLERVLSRAKVTFTHDVVTDRISITDRITELADRLEAEGSFSFESCFAFVEQGGEMAQIKGQVVVTFLAILEMTRLKMVRLTQADRESAIYITKAGADLKLQAEALRDRPEEYKE